VKRGRSDEFVTKLGWYVRGQTASACSFPVVWLLPRGFEKKTARAVCSGIRLACYGGLLLSPQASTIVSRKIESSPRGVGLVTGPWLA
jgi:hypothetical protein